MLRAENFLYFDGRDLADSVTWIHSVVADFERNQTHQNLQKMSGDRPRELMIYQF